MIAGVLITMKGSDLAGITAFQALVSEMGYSERLLELSRHDLWLCEFDESDGEALNDMERALLDSLKFANPNRQTFELRPGDSPLLRRAGRDMVTIFVWSKDNREGVAVHRNLEEIHGLKLLKELVAGVIWRLNFSLNPSQEELRTITKLFANPSYQGSVVEKGDVLAKTLFDASRKDKRAGKGFSQLGAKREEKDRSMA